MWAVQLIIYCPITQTHAWLVFTSVCNQHAVGRVWGHARRLLHSWQSLQVMVLPSRRQTAGFDVWLLDISAVWSWVVTSLPALQCARRDSPIQWWGRWNEAMVDRDSGKSLTSTEHSVTIVTPELDPSSCLPSLMQLHVPMSACSLK